MGIISHRIASYHNPNPYPICTLQVVEKENRPMGEGEPKSRGSGIDGRRRTTSTSTRTGAVVGSHVRVILLSLPFAVNLSLVTLVLALVRLIVFRSVLVVDG